MRSSLIGLTVGRAAITSPTSRNPTPCRQNIASLSEPIDRRTTRTFKLRHYLHRARPLLWRECCPSVPDHQPRDDKMIYGFLLSRLRTPSRFLDWGADGHWFAILVNYAMTALPNCLLAGIIGAVAAIGKVRSTVLPLLACILASSYGSGSLQYWWVNI